MRRLLAPRVHLGLVVPLHQGLRRRDEPAHRRLRTGRSRAPSCSSVVLRTQAAADARRADDVAPLLRRRRVRQRDPVHACSPGARNGSPARCTAVLNASTPLFTAIIAAVYLKDRLRPIQVGGLLLGFAGVSVAAGFGGGDLAHSSVLGSLAAVARGRVLRHRVRVHAQAPHRRSSRRSRRPDSS